MYCFQQDRLCIKRIQTGSLALSMAQQLSALHFLYSACKTLEFRLCSFQMPWHTVGLIISATNSEISKPTFAFSQAYIFHARASFFTSNLESSASALSTTNFFSISYPRRRLQSGNCPTSRRGSPLRTGRAGFLANGSSPYKLLYQEQAVKSTNAKIYLCSGYQISSIKTI